MEQLISVNEAASLLGLKASTVREWAKRGRLPSIKISTRRLFRASDLEAWVKVQSMQPANSRHSKLKSFLAGQ